MNTLKELFFDTTGALFLGAFVVLLLLFLLDFKFTSRQSWIALAAFAVIGGFFALQARRRRRLLLLLEEREKALAELEKKYDRLKEEAKLSEEAWRAAKAELEAAKLETAKAILRADGELDAELTAIENEYAHLTVEESMAKIKEALRNR